MAKLKSTKVLQQKANEVDVNMLIDAIEEVILKDEERCYEVFPAPCVIIR